MYYTVSKNDSKTVNSSILKYNKLMIEKQSNFVTVSTKLSSAQVFN